MNREMHRALVDAGMAPLADYVEAYSPTPTPSPPCGCRKCQAKGKPDA